MPIKDFAKENYLSVLETVRALCAIPAPSHFEQERAEFCKHFLKERGAKDAYIDEACNVILPIGCENSDEITVFAAHTDTVFPDREPMPFFEDDENIYCPGVWDDTAAVAVILHMAVYYLENGIVPPKGIMFVCNSCEEGLGNLKGTRTLMQAYEGRIARFISFDCIVGGIVNRAVGSHRYEVEVNTEGGHSFASFGNKNAIAVLSEMVGKIYAIEVPKVAGTKTTFNVGMIEGGTSVNTIAQNAKMLCEYRSDSAECLAVMKTHFEEIFSAPYGAEVSVKVVGERPCGRHVDAEKQKELDLLCEKAISEVYDLTAVYKSGSTDCNIPLSMGVPSACVGVSVGRGAHTRNERLKKASVIPGLEFALRLAELLT